MEGSGNVSIAMKYVWPGKVLQVTDPQDFWMKLMTREAMQQFERLQKDMQLFAQRDWESSDIETLETGMIVLVSDGSAETPYLMRGQITHIMQDGTVNVFYVDYGTTELTTAENICTFVPVQFKECPPQAIKCRLAGISPLVNSWTTRGIKTFQKLTNDCVLNVLILNGDHGVLEVALYPSSESNGRSVAHCLITEEVAMPIDERPVPEFLLDIPTFLNPGYHDNTPPVNGSPSSHGDDIKSDASPKPSVVSPSAEKYIPPHQKNHTSASSSICSLGGSPASNSGSLMKSPKIAASPPTNNASTSKSKEPVNDFFPFDNVSVCPPSPGSPIKPPSKALSGASRSEYGSQNGSYFSKSPSRYEQNHSINGVKKSPGPGPGPGPGRYTNNDSYNRPLPPLGRHHTDRHRVIANFDNAPALAPVNTFEPDYLNSKPGSKSGTGANGNSSAPTPNHNESSKYDRSPNHSFSETDFRASPRPRLYIPNASNTPPPFYPPQQMSGDQFRGNPPPVSRSVNLPAMPPGLVPPGFFQAHAQPPPHLAGQYYPPQPHPPGHPNPNHGQPFTSSSPIKVPGSRGYDGRTNSNNHYYPDQQNTAEGRYGYDSAAQNYAEYNKNQNYQLSPSMGPSTGRSPVKGSSLTTPTKHENPDSPESPAIDAFNLSDLDHTNALSVEHFHQRTNQERLQALQEEAEDIAMETKEQAELANIARFGAKFQSPDDEFADNNPWGKSDIYDEIEAYTSNPSYNPYNEYKEMKSPAKRTPTKTQGKVSESFTTTKVDNIPTTFAPDINLTDSVEEALEYGKTEGMDKAVVFLDSVVEQLKKSAGERQLFDVVNLLLNKAIEDFNFSVIVMDTINSLYGQFDIKDCLLKALKRKQELYIRVSQSDQSLSYHTDCARVMGLVCNMVTDWNESTSTVQDGILVSVEKWIVFNRMGAQTGQVEKENIFLDCFIAFWDVSGPFLISRNHPFISRIKNDVKKKILNENVARPIRERLLDILLDLFPVQQEMFSMSTQTPRITMIPSSCQVRPSTCEQETWISTDMIDEEYRTGRESMLSVEWSGNQYDDQSFYSCYGTPTQSNKPTSCEASPASVSVSDSANQSCTVPLADQTEANDELDDPEQDKQIGKMVHAEGAQATGKSKDSERKVRDDTPDRHKDTAVRKSDTPVRHSVQTVAEKMSGAGKSIVDWFDYEPPSQETIKCDTKLEEKRLEVKKKLDSATMEIIESDVAQKYAPTKSDNKSKKKNKKDKKSSGSIESEKSKSPKEKGVKEEIKSDSVKQSPDRSQNVVESNDDVKQGGDKTAECKEDKNIDWWGVGETQVNAAAPASIPHTYMDDIYVDNGPDVIIENELELSINDDIADAVYSDSQTVDTEHVLEEEVKQTNKTSPDGSESTSDNEIGQNRILTGAGVQDYAFDVDDDDDDSWDSDNSDDDNNDDKWAGGSGINKPSVETPPNDAEFPLPDAKGTETVVNSNQKLLEPQPQPSASRWVPGRRKCLNCHSHDHTTAECKEKYNLI